MNEKNFKLLALVISIIGLLILYAMTLFVKYEDYSIISEQDQIVKIKGEIISYRNNENITRIKIRHVMITDAVIFDKNIEKDIEKKINYSNQKSKAENNEKDNINGVNKNITIIGKVDYYKSRQQLIVERVK